jgi:hypothetical protein
MTELSLIFSRPYDIACSRLERRNATGVRTLISTAGGNAPRRRCRIIWCPR